MPDPAGLLRPRFLLRLEGAVTLGTALVAYWALDGSWVVFGLGFLLPDVALLGFLTGNRMGTVLYNLAHTYLFPLSLGGLAMLSASHPAGLAALIWVAHLGFDRMLGFGLKYEVSRKETHLQKI